VTQIVAVVALVGLSVLSYVFAVWIGPKVGVDTSRLPRVWRTSDEARPRLRIRRGVAAGVLSLVVAMCVAVWAFAAGETGVGIVAVVAVAILPEVVLIPMRRSRARPREFSVRGRRDGTDTSR
jgi:hypothetical protein